MSYQPLTQAERLKLQADRAKGMSESAATGWALFWFIGLPILCLLLFAR